MKIFLFAMVCACLGCAARGGAVGRGTLITPSSQTADVAWSDAERAQPVAMRNLRRAPEASFHLLRVKGERPTHVHANSDAVMFIVAGELTASVDGRSLPLKGGDVLELPRDTAYALASVGTEPAVAYLVFTPGLAADDDKAIVEAASESAWQWNLWVQ
jgi:mannose-6-phosphate isomerase-like protein (cupin superfamily)